LLIALLHVLLVMIMMEPRCSPLVIHTKAID